MIKEVLIHEHVNQQNQPQWTLDW